MIEHKIKEIKARFILDSRGNPTIETDVILSNGLYGRASVPSGASTGTHEAIELRDKQQNEYLGKHVKRAIETVHNKIYPLLKNLDINNIKKIDQTMIHADGTKNKSNLGANSILSVSLACLKAGAKLNNMHLYEYINKHYNQFK